MAEHVLLAMGGVKIYYDDSSNTVKILGIGGAPWTFATGPTGPAGASPRGGTGPTGATGPTGPTGPTA